MSWNATFFDGLVAVTPNYFGKAPDGAAGGEIHECPVSIGGHLSYTNCLWSNVAFVQCTDNTFEPAGFTSEMVSGTMADTATPPDWVRLSIRWDHGWIGGIPGCSVLPPGGCAPRLDGTFEYGITGADVMFDPGGSDTHFGVDGRSIWAYLAPVGGGGYTGDPTNDASSMLWSWSDALAAAIHVDTHLRNIGKCSFSGARIGAQFYSAGTTPTPPTPTPATIWMSLP